MNYVVYNCRNEYLLLERETDILQTYISLQKQIYPDFIEIDFETKIFDSNRKIVPGLIMSFIHIFFQQKKY